MKRSLWVSLLALTLLASCASYTPYAVKGDAEAFTAAQDLDLRPGAVLQTAEYSVYEAQDQPGSFYLLPAHIEPVQARRGVLLATALQRSDGEHMVFSCALAPRQQLLLQAEKELAQRGKAGRVAFYRPQSLDIRPLTDPRTPADISMTALGAPGYGQSPFHVGLIVQLRSRQNILAFTQMVNLNAGFLFEAQYEVRFKEQGVVRKELRVVQGVVRNAEITTLSM